MGDLTLIQPNRVTNARYDFTALQKNIIYHIIEALQRYMTKEKGLNKDLFSNFVVSIPVTELMNGKNHFQVIEAAKELMTKPFQYDYEKDKGKYTVATVLVHTAEHKHGSNTVELTIPEKALGLLVFIAGGFTPYQKTIAICLKSKHSKRMYELCSRWKDKGGFNMSLEEFKKMLCLEKSYEDPSLLRKQVLDKAQKELKASSDVWFEYEIKKVKSRSFNWIYFKIFNNDPKQAAAEKGVYPMVYNFLLFTFPNMFSDKALVTTDLLDKREELAVAWGKFRPLWERYKNDEIDGKYLSNITKKILREDFDINTD